MEGDLGGIGKRLLREERGQNMVELALLLPLLLLLIFGVIDFARAFNYKDQATQVANETARWFIVDQLPGQLNPTSVDIYKSWANGELVDSELKKAAPVSAIKICFTNAAGQPITSNPQAGDSVTVRIPVSLTPVNFVGKTLNIGAFKPSGQATMRLELTPKNSMTGDTWSAQGVCGG